jgi:hypothetical protein
MKWKNKVEAEKALTHQMRLDIKQHLSKRRQKALQKKIHAFIRQQKLSLSRKKKNLLFLKVMATYATSYEHYGPVLTEWAECLLHTAFLEKRSLIFIARDGLAPYKAARILQKKAGEKYKDLSLSIVYLSRTLVYSSSGHEKKISSADSVVKEYVQVLGKQDPFLLKKYIQQETGLKKRDNCLFVDIGFAGSMNPIISEQLSSLNLDIKFNYLISHTKKTKVKNEAHRAWGFLAHSEDRPLAAVAKAGGNPAVHWLEDTHQSILNSPKILIKNTEGSIVPALVQKHGDKFIVEELFAPYAKTCMDDPEKFLIKWYGFKGALDRVKKSKPSQNSKCLWDGISEEKRKIFASFLEELQSRKRRLLMEHSQIDSREYRY